MRISDWSSDVCSSYRCRSGEGAGRVHREKSLQVNIPQGDEDGTRIRLAGEGEAGLRGAPAGDLYIFLSVAPHRLFQRDGANIYCRVPLPMNTAALGGSIEVPTIGAGRSKITVPEGTQTNQKFRLKIKGMPVLRPTAIGDSYLEATITPPVQPP